jgi:uncharacterized damage-inducible protein DinB
VIDRLFLDYSVAKLDQYRGKIEICVRQLGEDQIWSRGRETENSIGNLCLHLSGNVRQWIVSGVGGAPDHRNRDSEFDARGGLSADELITRLNQTVAQACDVIATLTPMRLEERITIQNYRLSVLEAVYHVVEHFSHHTGQILFAMKAISGEDLGFYRHLAQATHDEATP